MPPTKFGKGSAEKVAATMNYVVLYQGIALAMPKDLRSSLRL
jgi:hypothetical protein